MLNFRKTKLIFLFLFLLAMAWHIAFGLAWYVYLLLFIAFTLILFLGSYRIGSQFYMKTVCSAKTGAKQIAISFDDGPDENHTPSILNTLKDQQIKAVFFCIGKQVQRHPELLKRIYAEGHIIGSHSYSHSFWFDLRSALGMKNDLQQLHHMVRQILGVELKWFRPPYGVTNPHLKKAVEAMNYTAIGWSVRSMDTVIKDENKLFLKLAKQLKPGAVFLFHDTCRSTALMLPGFLQFVKEQGFEVVPPDKLLHLQPYA